MDTLNIYYRIYTGHTKLTCFFLKSQAKLSQ